MKLSKVLLALSLAVLGCAPSGGGEEEGESYLAFSSSFQGFRKWEAFPVPEGAGGDPVHTMGPRTEYLKHRPGDDDTAFPVRTIIVKESNEGTLGDRTVFAMVKRGAGYNAQGAAGWEWFELKNLDETNVDILWRGVGPPAGEKYGGDPNAGCNSCHEGAADNDFVLSSKIRLGGM